MRILKAISAVLLALPLLGFGLAYYIHPPALPPANGQVGLEMLHLMREGGLTVPVTLSHIIAGIFLLIPRTRFLAALLQLPMTIGIVAFHATMWLQGIPPALAMLALNAVILIEPGKWRAMVARRDR